MNNSELAGEEARNLIGRHGCCLGTYRVLLAGVYYCYLGSVLECRHQERGRIRQLGEDVFVCETKRQEPCHTCDLYSVAAKTRPLQPVAEA
ncbi:MAG: hypothetical protein ACYTGB_05680 [Planctomycetota bacterium]|jgi:hypothetical protein